MSQQGQELALQFERANSELIAAIEQCPDARWWARCEPEGWTVAATAHHVAASHRLIAEWVRIVATGLPESPTTMAMIHEDNARHAVEYAACTKEETIALLRHEGVAAAQLVRGLSDEQLQRVGPFHAGIEPWSTERVIEAILIGHGTGHLRSIRAASGT